MSLEQQAGAEDDFLHDGHTFTADDVQPSGAFSGLGGAIGGGVAAGALQSVSVLADGLPKIARALYGATLYGETGKPEEFQKAIQGKEDMPWMQKLDDYSDAVAHSARNGAQAATPDPRTTGAASNVVFGAAKVLTEAGLSTAATGSPFAGAGALAYIEGLSRYKDLREQGVDDATAQKLATLDGVLQGGGMLVPAGLPAKWLSEFTPIKALLTQLATGAVGNAGLGAGSRYATAKILDAAGYHDMANQSRVLDGEAIAADLLTGGFFGGASHLMGAYADRAMKAADSGAIDSSVRDAAKVVQDAHQFNVERAPGVAVDMRSQALHRGALQDAVESLLADKPVNVDAEGATFARPADDPIAHQQAKEQFLQTFKESGVLDEEASLRDLEEQLGKLQEMPPVKPLGKPVELPKEEGGVEPAEVALGRAKDESDRTKEEAPKMFKALAECAGATA